MSVRSSAPGGVPGRYTSAALTAGVAAAAACFAVALAAEVAGAAPGKGSMTDPGAVLDGLLALTPWAWATAGAYAVVATPVLGLVVTALEFASVRDRRTVWLAIAVIVVLAVSSGIAILR